MFVCLKCPLKASPYEASLTLHLDTCFWTCVFHLKTRRLKNAFGSLEGWGGKGREGMEDAAFPASGSLNQSCSRVKYLFLSQELVFMLHCIYPGTFLHTGGSSGLAAATSKTNRSVLGKKHNKTPTALASLVYTLAKQVYPFTPEVAPATENLSIKMKKTFRKKGKGLFSAKAFHFSILKTAKREASMRVQQLTGKVRCSRDQAILRQQQCPCLPRVSLQVPAIPRRPPAASC